MLCINIDFKNQLFRIADMGLVVYGNLAFSLKYNWCTVTLAVATFNMTTARVVATLKILMIIKLLNKIESFVQP